MKKSRSSPFAILGLLGLKPMSGYDVRKAAAESVGYFWSESYGQIYPALRELESAGWTRKRTERQAGRPDRHVYEITARGRAALARWLAEPPRPTPVRSELLLKLFFGAAADGGPQVAWLEQMRAQADAELETFTRIERQIQREQDPNAPHWLVTVRYGALRAEANRRWAEESIATLRAAARRAKAEPKARAVRATTRRPRAGRA